MSLKKKLVIWLAHRLPPCQDVTRLASEAMDRRLPLQQWIKMKLHFLTCSLCLRYFQQLQLMRELAHRHGAQANDNKPSANAALSPAARERLKRMLDSSSPE